MMSIADTFLEYASAFEETVIDDNWSRLEKYFSTDATYSPGNGDVISGRDNIFSFLKGSIDGLDRQFDSRHLDISPQPDVSGSQTTAHWHITFKKEGIPDLSFSGIEVATFEDGVICKLEDTFDDGAAEGLQEWMSKHAGALA
jgi:hypothetical protein